MSFCLVLKVKWCSSREGLWVTATDGGTVCTWDPLTATPLNTMNHMGQAVTALLVDDVNEVILLCTVNDNLIHMFKLTLQNEICTYSGHSEQVHAMVYLDNRKQYLSSSWDLTLCVWLGPHKDPKLINDQVPVGDAKVITINPLLWLLYVVYESWDHFLIFIYGFKDLFPCIPWSSQVWESSIILSYVTLIINVRNMFLHPRTPRSWGTIYEHGSPAQHYPTTSLCTQGVYEFRSIMLSLCWTTCTIESYSTWISVTLQEQIYTFMVNDDSWSHMQLSTGWLRQQLRQANCMRYYILGINAKT